MNEECGRKAPWGVVCRKPKGHKDEHGWGYEWPPMRDN